MQALIPVVVILNIGDFVKGVEETNHYRRQHIGECVVYGAWLDWWYLENNLHRLINTIGADENALEALEPIVRKVIRPDADRVMFKLHESPSNDYYLTKQSLEYLFHSFGWEQLS
jgi:hypothetical protein